MYFRKTIFLKFSLLFRYGLILPQKKGLSKTAMLPKLSVFGDDSDDEVNVMSKIYKPRLCHSFMLTWCCLSFRCQLGRRCKKKQSRRRWWSRWSKLKIVSNISICVIYLFIFHSWLKTRLEMQKALDQDSTVYDYDSVYDDIQKQRVEINKKILGGTDKKVSDFCWFYSLWEMIV